MGHCHMQLKTIAGAELSWLVIMGQGCTAGPPAPGLTLFAMLLVQQARHGCARGCGRLDLQAGDGMGDCGPLARSPDATPGTKARK
jgi:hypothetical protein